MSDKPLDLNSTANGIQWLLEMGLIDHPAVLYQIQLNLIGRYKAVRDFELIILEPPMKRFMVLLKFGRFRGLFVNKEEIAEEAEEILSKMLKGYHVDIFLDEKEFYQHLEIPKAGKQLIELD